MNNKKLSTSCSEAQLLVLALCLVLILDAMTERIQLNLRLDGNRELFEAVKAEAARLDTSVNSFVINALKTVLEWQDLESSAQSTPSVETIIEALMPRLDNMLEEKLNKKLEEKVGESAA